MRQAGHFFLNGQPIGKYENGVTAVGLDITKFAKFGGQDNVLAVQGGQQPRPTRRKPPARRSSGTRRTSIPNFGGLNRDATLIVTGKVYQTLPLYENLKTTGIYIYPQNIDLKKKTADVNVEAEVVNETGDYASITLSAVVVDADGIVRAKLDGNTSDLVGGQTEIFTAAGPLADARFWDVDDPYLYDVYSILTRERQGGGRLQDADRLPQDRIQGRRRHRRRLAERPLRLADRLLAALGQRLAGPRRRLSRLDARLHRRAHAREQRQLHPLDARLARSGPTSRRATNTASSSSAPRATRKSASPAASGTSASRSCATP